MLWPILGACSVRAAKFTDSQNVDTGRCEFSAKHIPESEVDPDGQNFLLEFWWNVVRAHEHHTIYRYSFDYIPQNSWANWIVHHVIFYCCDKLTYERRCLANLINLLFVSITYPFIIFIMSERFLRWQPRPKLFDFRISSGRSEALVISRLILVIGRWLDILCAPCPGMENQSWRMEVHFLDVNWFR